MTNHRICRDHIFGLTNATPKMNPSCLVFAAKVMHMEVQTLKMAGVAADVAPSSPKGPERGELQLHEANPRGETKFCIVLQPSHLSAYCSLSPKYTTTRQYKTKNLHFRPFSCPSPPRPYPWARERGLNPNRTSFRNYEPRKSLQFAHEAFQSRAHFGTLSHRTVN